MVSRMSSRKIAYHEIVLISACSYGVGVAHYWERAQESTLAIWLMRPAINR